MILISHRGNTAGPNIEKENSPEYLKEAISMGYNVEVDIWLISQTIFLGHDEPTYEVTEDFIKEISKEAWFHCKNIESLYMFKTKYPDFKYFWHESDKFTLTSNNIIWTYPDQPVTPQSIMVCLSRVPSDWTDSDSVYGVCSDYALDWPL